MADRDKVSFKFVSKCPDLDEETFSVVKFKGASGISELYEYNITLVSEDPDIDPLQRRRLLDPQRQPRRRLCLAR